MGPAWELPLEAGLWGLMSASSLLVGAVLGMCTTPTQHMTALLMAFGGGCLIYAVSVQLFGRAGHMLEMAENEDTLDFRVWNIRLQGLMSLLGALLYLGLNELLCKMQDQPDEPERIAEVEMQEVRTGKRSSAGRSVDSYCRRTSTISGTSLSMNIHARRGGMQRMSRIFEGNPTFWRQRDSTSSSFTGRPSEMSALSSSAGPNPSSRRSTKAGKEKGRSTLQVATRTISYKKELNGKIETKLSSEVAQLSSVEAKSPDKQQREIKADVLAEVAALGSSELSEQIGENTADTLAQKHAASVAFSMWLGLLLDGIPESLLIGFMTNSSKIEIVFVIAIFIANFPEAYSAAAILYGQGVKWTKIMGMWGLVFLMTGCLAAFGSAIMPKDAHGDSELERFEERASAIMEGITGGSMMAMIATAMLPEAFHQAGASSGLLFVCGFGASHQLAAIGAQATWAAPCIEHYT